MSWIKTMAGNGWTHGQTVPRNKSCIKTGVLCIECETPSGAVSMHPCQCLRSLLDHALTKEAWAAAGRRDSHHHSSPILSQAELSGQEFEDLSAVLLVFVGCVGHTDGRHREHHTRGGGAGDQHGTTGQHHHIHPLEQSDHTHKEKCRQWREVTVRAQTVTKIFPFISQFLNIYQFLLPPAPKN